MLGGAGDIETGVNGRLNPGLEQETSCFGNHAVPEQAIDPGRGGSDTPWKAFQLEQGIPRKATIIQGQIHDFIEAHHYLHNIVPALGAVIVVVVGKYLASRAASDEESAAEEKAA